MRKRIHQFAGWLMRRFPPATDTCAHRWRILIEHYPTFATDRWQCRACGKCQTFPFGEPPIKMELEVCNLGTMHIMNGLRGDDSEEEAHTLDAEIIG